MSLELALIYSAPSHQAPCEGKLIKNSSEKEKCFLRLHITNAVLVARGKDGGGMRREKALKFYTKPNNSLAMLVLCMKVEQL